MQISMADTCNELKREGEQAGRTCDHTALARKPESQFQYRPILVLAFLLGFVESFKYIFH